MSPSPNEINELVQRWQTGDSTALDRLLPLVYADLRAMAARTLGGAFGHATLQPTALVNDVFVRLLGARQIPLESGSHLLNLAARTMRLILVDRLREKQREKRGGTWQRVDLIEALQLPIPEQTDLGLLDAAITDLQHIDERLARIVELRYFVGLSVPAVAAVLGVDKRTVYRDWALAKAWLMRNMQR